MSWATVSAAWYDGTTRTLGLTSQTAVWYRSGKPPVPLRWVLVRDPQGEFTPQALLCTDPSADPTQILEWFVLRWQLEVTFQEVRAHLGVETQRQWSDQAIARTTPILMGLFSWTTLAAHLLRQQRPSAHRTAAWYAKPSPTFVDAIALVRRHLWLASEGFSLSAADPDIRKVPAALYHRLVACLRGLKCAKPRPRLVRRRFPTWAQQGTTPLEMCKAPGQDQPHLRRRHRSGQKIHPGTAGNYYDVRARA